MEHSESHCRHRGRIWPLIKSQRKWVGAWVSLVWALVLSRDVVSSSSSSSLPRQLRGCSSDLDCSLNGRCLGIHDNANALSSFSSPSRVCDCDKPWSGHRCETLRFVPFKGKQQLPHLSSSSSSKSSPATATTMLAPQGYGMVPNVTAWGGGILVEPFNSSMNMYHLYVSRMTNDCPLSKWHSNSRIDHATSFSITGPYQFESVAIPTFSHNPAPVKLSSKNNDQPWKYAIFHLGDGTSGENGGKDCRSNSSVEEGSNGWMSNQPQQQQRGLFRNRKGAGSTIHASESPSGPWVPVEHDLGHCNNPAPWVHPSNGTLYVLCSYSGMHSILHKSQSGTVSGHYQRVTDFAPANATPSDGENKGEGVEDRDTAYEDPFLYTDPRGNFHVIYHAYQYAGTDGDCRTTRVSAHSYSEDGYEWHTSPTPPYGSQIEVESETTNTTTNVTLASRERPKLVLDGETGLLTHLVEGVCGAPFCDARPYKPFCVHCKYQSWDFTLVSTLDAS